MDLLIFDLDGTLIDSRLDLANAVNAMRSHLGMSALPNERVYTYVGNGAPLLVRRSLGDQATEEECRRRSPSSWNITARTPWSTPRSIPACASRSTASATPEADGGAHQQTGRHQPPDSGGTGGGRPLLPYFRRRQLRAEEADPIGVETLMQEAGVDRAHTMMVGDSAVDVATARNAGIACCGVTYGFQPDSLRDPAPEIIVDRMEQFADWLLKK
jgi:phosphoglycolate phosphatase